MRRFSHELRWTIVVIVLAIAGVIALWPGNNPLPPPETRPGPSTVNPDSSLIDDTALAPLRQRAALQPCPTPQTGTTGSGVLAGISVPCLGNPGQVNLAAAFSGKPALLNLWASWCQPCRAEMPVLDEYAHRGDAIAVLGVNVQDRPADALDLLADLGVRYPSVVDVANALQRALRAPAVLPVTYLLRPDGTVHRITEPAVFTSAQDIDNAVHRYLSG